jgi:glutamyl-Q tRNA(Asp) synthetase
LTPHASYIGRFAPSPSGPLHLGSLIAALASWLDARSQAGIWCLRMEDLDRPRVTQAHADDILRTLERFGLCWDGTILYQSTRAPAYAEALDTLIQQQRIYACTCTRRELADSQAGIDGPLYPGHCRGNPPELSAKHALRLKAEAREYRILDRIHGEYSQVLASDIGDFILRRSDGLYAYQLAVVVDDASQGITHVVRGADLLSSSPRQVYLQQLLGYPTPTYAHVPLLVDAAGAKLSKRETADPVSLHLPETALLLCLKWLGQAPPAELSAGGRDEILAWATAHWDISRIPRVQKITAPSMA